MDGLATRYRYLLRFYLLTVLFFLIAKPVFMYCNQEVESFSAGDVADVLLHGLTLDLSTALYLLLPPFLCVAASVWVRVPQWLLKLWAALAAMALSLAFVADTSLYSYWKFKLDASCLAWLETPDEAVASVSSVYLIVRLVCVALLAAVFYGCYAFRLFKGIPLKGRRRLTVTLVNILLLAGMIIGMRGGIDESTTNIGQVYYSQNQFLNHSAVNPVFSFLSSFEQTASRLPDYHFMNEDELQQELADCFFTDSRDIDTLLNTRRPNVVIVLMESSGELFAQAMPRLQQLKQEGIYFAHCHANSWRTDRGTVCTLSGYPSFPMASVMKMPTKAQTLPGIAASLRKEGYATSYVYGGDINFTNMRSYLVSTGFERLFWMDDYSVKEQNTAKWGVRDDITIASVAAQIADYTSQGQPFVIGYSTLSSHEPWDVPVQALDDEVDNAFYYLDQCIGNFVDSLRLTPAWQNLLLIFLPDHGVCYHGLTLADLEFSHIPMVWVGGAVRQPRRIAQYCNQTDLAATLLGQMGIDHSDFPFSRDVMSRSYTRPFAVCTFNNGFLVADTTGYAMLDLTSGLLISSAPTAPQLISRGKAVLQAASDDLRQLGK